MRRAVLAVALALAACYHNAPAPRTTPIEDPKSPDQPIEQHEQVGRLYSAEEALADVLSGPLTYVGTGEWFGLFRVYSCVYRNERVFVVNMYCTKTNEMKAFGLVVLSPTRGRAYLYGEAEKPISTVRRPDYFTMKMDAEPVVVDEKLPPLSMAFSFADLRKWDEARYNHYLPGCFAGIENKRPQAGCMKDLDELKDSWPAAQKPFLDNPPAAWYQLISDMRARAKTEGKNFAK
jgi:hypothetical protein